jgi:hypothetical protein
MPFGSEGVERGVGLALSGGGFRATLFHLGSLWRLNLFTEEEQTELINWGYPVCDAAMRRHVLPDAAPPPALPFPAFALDR